MPEKAHYGFPSIWYISLETTTHKVMTKPILAHTQLHLGPFQLMEFLELVSTLRFLLFVKLKSYLPTK